MIQPGQTRAAAGAGQIRDADLDVYGLTHPGRSRDTNQDHFLICTLHKAMRVRRTSLPNPELLEMPSERLAALGMVADGVGGGMGGEEASRLTLEAIAAYVTHTMQSYYTADPDDQAAFVECLQNAALQAHEAVQGQGKSNPSLAGMSTTLTLAISVWPELYVLHLGDSRAYRLRDGTLERLTRDQTMAQEMLETGVFTESAAERSPYAHVLSSAIGGEFKPEVGHFDSLAGDRVLLCTDGLTKHVSDERIHECLSTATSAEQACHQLVDEALADGGTDNVTVIVGLARLEG